MSGHGHSPEAGALSEALSTANRLDHMRATGWRVGDYTYRQAMRDVRTALDAWEATRPVVERNTVLADWGKGPHCERCARRVGYRF